MRGVLWLVLAMGLALPARADEAEKGFKKAMAAAGGDAGKQEAAVRALGREGAPGARLLGRLAVDPALPAPLRDAAGETFDGLSSDAAVQAWAASALAPGKAREKESALRVLCVELLASRLKAQPELAERLLPALADESWSVQVAAIRGLVDAPTRETAGALCALAEKASGRVLLEASRALGALTGEEHADGPAWAAWWAAKGASWEPGAERPAPPAATAGGTVVRFNPTQSIFEGLASTRVIIVVDVSGSMQVRAFADEGGKKTLTRLEAVQAELARLIEEKLGEQDRFNLIAFSSDVMPWRKKLVPASKANKKAALDFVRALKPDGETNISDSLELAFQDPEVDTIHFLTDGTPSRGKLMINDEILAAVKRWNAGRRVRVCAVGFLAGDPTPFGVVENRGMSERFLQALAQQNEGTFRMFDD